MSNLQVRFSQGAILALAVALRVVAAALVGTSRVPWELEFEEIAGNLLSGGQYTFSFYHLTSIHLFLALRQQGYGDPFITCHIGDRLRNVPKSIGHPSPAAISVAPFASWAG